MADLFQIIQDMLKDVEKLRKFDLTTHLDEDLSDAKGDVVKARALELYNKYSLELKGTPEREYLSALLKHYDVENPHFYKKIDDIELSVRTSNVLDKADIKYIGELVQTSEADLRRLQNFGMKGLKELKDILAGMGLSLGMKIDFVRPNETEY